VRPCLVLYRIKLKDDYLLSDSRWVDNWTWNHNLGLTGRQKYKELNQEKTFQNKASKSSYVSKYQGEVGGAR